MTSFITYKTVKISVKRMNVRPGTTPGFRASFGPVDNLGNSSYPGNSYCALYSYIAIEQCKAEIDSHEASSFGMFAPEFVARRKNNADADYA